MHGNAWEDHSIEFLHVYINGSGTWNMHNEDSFPNAYQSSGLSFYYIRNVKNN